MTKVRLALLVVLLCLLAGGAAAKEITLDKTTKLIPQGWSVGEDVKFKKDTVVSLNEDGAVISGVLAEAVYLRPAGWERVLNNYFYTDRISAIWYPRFTYPAGLHYGVSLPAYGHVLFKGGGRVTFGSDGCVLTGVLNEKMLIALKKDSYGFVSLKSDCAVSFYEGGMLQSGTLDSDTKLRPCGWRTGSVTEDSAGFLEFKGGQFIEFDAEGCVLAGTVTKSAMWRQPDGSLLTLPPKSKVRFAAGSAVIEE